MKKNAFSQIAILSCAFLYGCASITNGTSEPVSVDTQKVTQATCSLKNNKGTWYVNKTPGSAVIHRSFADLVVKCHKDGYQDGQQIVKSHTKPMVFGNVIFGGAIGAGVDMVDGAAYEYPTNVTVPLQKNN